MAGFDKQFALDSPTGAQLYTYHGRAKQTPKGIVHINHGLAEHAARYAKFADDLNVAGYHVYAHDHRGHGHTVAPDASQGIFSSNDDARAVVFQDCAAVQAHAQAEHSGLPIIMFGHSMGGLITMCYALRHPEKLAGVAVWNSNFSGGILGRAAQTILGYEKFRLGSDVPSQIIPKLTFADWAKKMPDRRTKFDWLSHIEDQVDRYVADPLCGWDASVGMWQTIFKLVFEGGAVSRVSEKAKSLPIHLLGGGEDPATEGGKAVETQHKKMVEAGFSQVACTVFPNARHETLNDHDQDKATSEFIEFANTCVQTDG